MTTETDAIKSCIHVAEGESFDEMAQEAREELYVLVAWQEAIEELCTVNWINMTTPKETLQRLIQWEVTQALDPRISKAAEDLIEQGRKQRW
jgi:hypothetical protein